MTFVEIAFAIVTIALIVGNAYFLERRIKRARVKIEEQIQVRIREQTETIQTNIDRTLWPQLEGLISLYRMLDGREPFPPMRGGATSPDILLLLARHLQKNLVRTIVEFGNGTSTIVLAHTMQALNRDGHIYSLQNDLAIAEQLREELRSRQLDNLATVLICPLIEKRYDGFDHVFYWYDLSYVQIPEKIDLLFINGPAAQLNHLARYPAGPELLPRMARDGHVFIDNTKQKDEAQLAALWRTHYPDLGVRKLDVEKGALEMFFLDQKIQPFIRSAA